METIKINGFGVVPHGAPEDSYWEPDEVVPDTDFGECRPAVLLIGSGDQPPVVFTKEEVEAMLKEVFLSRRHFELSGGLPGMLIQPGDVEQIAAKHGLTL